MKNQKKFAEGLDVALSLTDGADVHTSQDAVYSMRENELYAWLEQRGYKWDGKKWCVSERERADT